MAVIVKESGGRKKALNSAVPRQKSQVMITEARSPRTGTNFLV